MQPINNPRPVGISRYQGFRASGCRGVGTSLHRGLLHVTFLVALAIIHFVIGSLIELRNRIGSETKLIA